MASSSTATAKLHPRLEALSKAIPPVSPMALFVPMTFLQNLVVDKKGNVVVNSVFDGRVWSLDPSAPFTPGIGANGKVVAQVPGQAQSVSEAPEGETGYVVVGPNLKGVTSMWHVDDAGKVELVVEIPKGIFPNGIESLTGGKYLFADSIVGVIWQVDFYAKTYKIFLDDELLKPLPNSWIPGANGVRVFKDKLYITNSAREMLLSVDLSEDNNIVPNTLKVVKTEIFVDDMDFDEQGNVYVTSHPFNAVQRLAPDGTLSLVAGPDQGASGNTGARFGRTDKDRSTLYVVTDGGLFNIGPDGIAPAKVLKLEIGVNGAPGGFKKSTAGGPIKRDEL